MHVGRRRRHPRPQAAGADPPDERDQEPDARPASLDSWDADEHAARNARLAAAYQTALAEAASLDFDDLLLGAVRLLHEHADARRAAGERFRRILVDEYQDTNLPQYVLLRQLSEDRDDVFVVGDPDQAIYGWRGAELRNILNFPAAQRIDLQLAYRSSARLLEAAAAMIRYNADRLEHRLRAANPPGAPLAVHHAADPAAEAAFAVARAAARLERDDGSVAVLYRTNAQSRAFEDAFRRVGIRYWVFRRKLKPVSEEVERRFRRKLNADFGKLNTDFGHRERSCVDASANASLF